MGSTKPQKPNHEDTMAACEALYETFKPHLDGMNKARIGLLSKIFVALIGANTISYGYLARKLETIAKLDSAYRQIQRFFAHFEIDCFVAARIFASLVPIEQCGWILTLDRTNWKFGKTNINFLVLGVAYKGVAIPLFWILLDKRGNSNWKERSDILSRFVECFGKDVIECFTADREFIGHRWLDYLKTENIPICIKTNENIHITDAGGVLKPGKLLFSQLGIGEHTVLKQRWTMGAVFDIVGCRLPTVEYLILLCSCEAEVALDLYRVRWQIETLLSCFKTSGFNFESAHVADLERLSREFTVMAFTLCWIHNVGEVLDCQKEMLVRKHGRKAKSIFHLGFEQLAQAISSINSMKKKYMLMAELFSSSANRLKDLKYKLLTW